MFIFGLILLFIIVCELGHLSSVIDRRDRRREEHEEFLAVAEARAAWTRPDAFTPHGLEPPFPIAGTWAL